ncbi:enoyl-CoA hydratase/isomerase family protein [Hyaloraphidium curvatum]|nr:enoyl-CoA hydratase/isomerase family protein [Hyaloraphidium curvatum]
MASAYSHYKTIKVAVEDTGVGIITFDRPKELNAVGAIDLSEVNAAVHQLEADDACKVIIVTGSGRAFSAGATLSNPDNRYGVRVKDPVKEEEHRDPGGPLAFAFEDCKKVTIAALNGVTVGIGATMILPMDIRITFKDNKIGWVFTRRGIVPESMSTYHLPRLLGQSRALGLFLTGRIMSASHPAVAPLFFELVDKPEDVMPCALEIAREIAKECSVPANAATKALVVHAAGSSKEQHLLDSRALHHFVVGKNVDVSEGLDSFKEKRSPAFKGKVKDAPTWLNWWNKAKL